MKKALTIEIISAALVLLFLYAGLSKLIRYDIFVFQLSESPFKLLGRSAHQIAWVIPATEIPVAAILPFTKTRLFGLYGSFVLMLLFTLYVGGILLSGLALPCACGGIISGLHWPGHLVFNIFFLGLSAVGISLERGHKAKTHDMHPQSYSIGG